MSTRLTNDLRDRIAADILRHRFTEQVDALIAARKNRAPKRLTKELPQRVRDVFGRPVAKEAKS